MKLYQDVLDGLRQDSKTWLITGVAGFIGSNLLEHLLKLDQNVVGLDNFSTGQFSNLDEVKINVSLKQWAKFKFIKGDIRDIDNCTNACANVDYVLHQAALGSVPRSIKDPIATNETNVNGFLNMMVASKDQGVKSFTYAASSSSYGDHKSLPKIEDVIGKPLSPYAVTKLVNELYADVFAKTYNFNSIGLRYFNVFGKRQSPNGPYAAVIPKWTSALINNESVHIYGDGETSRDFCFVENTIQANLLAAVADNKAQNQIYNIALGERTSLNQLYFYLKNSLGSIGVNSKSELNYDEFRHGDVKHSEADISKAKNLLGYEPKYKINKGIELAMPWYLSNLNKGSK